MRDPDFRPLRGRPSGLQTPRLPSLLRRRKDELVGWRQVEARLKPETSIKMRYLMRLNAEKGTATKTDVKGYYVGAKTGTAEKVVGRVYSKTKLLTDVMAVLPADDPKYLVLVMLDEPQIIPETHGFATSGWNAVPTAANIIARVAPLLGIEPRFDLPPADQQILAATKLTH